MQVSYRKILDLKSGLTLQALSGVQGSYLVLQGEKEKQRRLKRTYKSALLFNETKQDVLLKPVSLNFNAAFPSLLFEYETLGPLALFLSKANNLSKYQRGLDVGRAIRLLHNTPCPEILIKKASAVEIRNLKKLNRYISSTCRFYDEKETLEALTARFKSFKCDRVGLRFGALLLEDLLICPDGAIKIIPLPSFGVGDKAEDLASLCADASYTQPVFCAGVIDGYHGKEIPVNFWLSFAMYQALMSLCRFSALIERYGLDSDLGKEALFKSQQIRMDYDNFKNPIPKWYLSAEVSRVRAIALKKGL